MGRGAGDPSSVSDGRSTVPNREDTGAVPNRTAFKLNRSCANQREPSGRTRKLIPNHPQGLGFLGSWVTWVGAWGTRLGGLGHIGPIEFKGLGFKAWGTGPKLHRSRVVGMGLGLRGEAYRCKPHRTKAP